MTDQGMDLKYLTEDYWNRKWYGQDASWHKEDVNPTGEGPFDAIWDRGSFGAVNPEERERYARLFTALKTANTGHLLELFEYDDRLFKESPFSIPISKVFEYWGKIYDVKLIDSVDAPDMLRSVTSR